MGLPVGQIMAEVEEMLGRDEAGIEDAVDDFGDVQVEIVEGDKEGSTWLIVNGVHICHKQVENKNTGSGDAKISAATNAHSR